MLLACFSFTTPKSTSVPPRRYKHQTRMGKTNITTGYMKFSFSHWNTPINILNLYSRGHLLSSRENSKQLQKKPALLNWKSNACNAVLWNAQYQFPLVRPRSLPLTSKVNWLPGVHSNIFLPCTLLISGWSVFCSALVFLILCPLFWQRIETELICSL